MTSEVDAHLQHPAGTPQPGDVVDDKYRIDQVIGVGGMGVVLAAWHLQLEERVAIKVLLPSLCHDAEALGRFEREARAIVKLKSEHVARVLDVGRLASRTPYIVMEYLEGRDLGQILKGGYPLPVEEAVSYVLQACEVVAEAHSLGILHRDLKPENLFLTKRRDGSSCIKVLDFGLSKMRSGDGTPSRPDRALTALRQAMGTPNYMSPEQWMSARDVGPAADQWALAAISYELLVGKPAFGGKEIGQICGKVLNEQPPSITAVRQDVPPALEQALLRALEKDPSRRYPSIYEFAASLAPFGSELAAVSVERVAGIFHLSSGEHPAPLQAGAAERAGAESMAPTVPRVAPPAGLGDGTGDRQLQTAQSWQQMFGADRAGRGRSTVFALIAGAVVLLGAVILVAVMASRPRPAIPAPEAAAEREGEPSAPASGEPRSAFAGEDAGAGAHASPGADAGPTDGASTAEPAPSPRSTAPRAPRPRPRPRRPKPSIFDSRQ